MTTRDDIRNEYFEWLSNLVGGNGESPYTSYRKLLMCLHEIQFRYSIPKDKNRADDGVALRYRFASYNYPSQVDEILYDLSGHCSVLEMIAALAIRGESIMDDPKIGDRTTQWFWEMIVNLGLGSMTDALFDKQIVVDKVSIFLDRKYEPNGKGGLFFVRHCDRDLRTVEIWWQLCWYLDEIS